jgi:hypothetical protein
MNISSQMTVKVKTFNTLTKRRMKISIWQETSTSSRWMTWMSWTTIPSGKTLPSSESRTTSSVPLLARLVLMGMMAWTARCSLGP